MAAGITITLKRKAGAFADGDLAAGEVGVDTTNGQLYLSANGSTVRPVQLVPGNTQTASYTLVLSDGGKSVEMNVAGANTLTVPPESNVAFPIGTVVEVAQLGAGQVTLTPGTGVTIRTASSLTTRAQYSVASLRKRATDEWVAAGDLT